MKVKRNESTINRPEGHRIIDAPFLFLDFPKFIRQLKKEKAWQENGRNGITIFKSEELTMVVTILQEAGKIGNNQLNEYLILQVINGRINVKTSQGVFKMEKKQAMVFHPRLSHSIKALKKTALLLTTFNSMQGLGFKM